MASEKTRAGLFEGTLVWSGSKGKTALRLTGGPQKDTHRCESSPKGAAGWYLRRAAKDPATKARKQAPHSSTVYDIGDGDDNDA